MKDNFVRAHIDFEQDDLENILRDLENGYRVPESFSISLPAYSIGCTNDYLDICEDLLDISYVFEKLGSELSSPKVVRSTRDLPAPNRTLFTLTGNNPKPNFILRLKEACVHYGGSIEYIKENYATYFSEYIGNMSDYRDSLQEKILRFPQIIDDYFANLVNGAYCTYEMSDWVQEDLLKHPERRFGYFRSAFSPLIGGEAYASLQSWIVPRSVTLDHFFSTINQDVSSEDFSEAKFVFKDGMGIALAKDISVAFPINQLMTSRTGQAFFDLEQQILTLGMQSPVFQTPKYQRTSPRSGISLENNDSTKNVLCIHHSGEIGVYMDREEGWNHVFFDLEPITIEQIKEAASSFSEVSVHLDHHLGTGDGTQLDWSHLSDDDFEMLCYDIIYSHPKFDHNRTQKMGLSRSRDGGRDIVAWTQPVAYREPPKKYIFQCKLVTSQKSLGKRSVSDIGDMLDQHNAEGFGVMTSAVMDATLIDACEKICERRKVSQLHFSKLEIERILRQRPNLFGKYFG